MTNPQHTLADLAKFLGAKLQGDPAKIITGINTLEQATTEQITFLDNSKYRKFLATTNAAAVILNEKELPACKANALIVANPYAAFAKIAALFERPLTPSTGIHPSAVIAANCQIHSSVTVGPYCVIEANVKIAEGVQIGAHCTIGERVVIGANSRLWPRVTLYHDVKIGSRVIIHSGAVIGSDGFGNANEQGKWIKVPQLGGVQIGNDVEIGANTTIDCGAINDTIIEDGVKLDNQIQVGHNVQIGAHTAIAACTAIAGSTKIGKYCMIGGGVGISGHIEITDKVMIGGMSGVSNSIETPGIYMSGMSAMPSRAWWKNLARFRQLDEIARTVHQLENNKAKSKE